VLSKLRPQTHFQSIQKRWNLEERAVLSCLPGEHFGEQRTLANIVRRCSANEHEHTPLGVFVVRQQKSLGLVQSVVPEKAAKTADAQL
jgi:hypothetical protein